MLIGYHTDKKKGRFIVEQLTKTGRGEIRHIDDYLHHGLPRNCSAVIFQGILRGSGMLYKECLAKDIPFYYVDHAYFDPNKEYDPHAGWMRVTKNGFVQNKIKSVSGSRWKKFFSTQYQIQDWKGDPRRGDHILVLPPTPAVRWMFGVQDWGERVYNQLKNITDKPIIWREKPSQVKVDKLGYPRGKVPPDAPAGTFMSARPLEYDILNAHAVVAYNSNVAVDATLQGIPVVCSENCPAYPISFSIRDIGTNKLAIEPNRKQWLYSLAGSQVNMQEIKSGDAWSIINE